MIALLSMHASDAYSTNNSLETADSILIDQSEVEWLSDFGRLVNNYNRILESLKLSNTNTISTIIPTF